MKQAKKREDPELWANAKILRNTCTNCPRKDRADYVKGNSDNNMGNSKEVWKNMQDVLPNKKNKSMIVCQKGIFQLRTWQIISTISLLT